MDPSVLNNKNIVTVQHFDNITHQIVNKTRYKVNCAFPFGQDCVNDDSCAQEGQCCYKEKVAEKKDQVNLEQYNYDERNDRSCTDTSDMDDPKIFTADNGTQMQYFCSSAFDLKQQVSIFMVLFAISQFIL